MNPQTNVTTTSGSNVASLPASNGNTKAPRFFAGRWTHLFGIGRRETACQIVVDVANDVLVAAQVWDGLKWVNLSAVEKKDLAESVLEANAVSDAPEDHSLVAIGSLPQWALPAVVEPKVTSRELVDRYPTKGSMPHAVVEQLYALRAEEVLQLASRDSIEVQDLLALDRGARFMVAESHFDACSVDARYALLNDVHHWVRSAAKLAQIELAEAEGLPVFPS